MLNTNNINSDVSFKNKTNWHNIMLNDIINYEKLNDFLLLKLKLNYSTIWTELEFLKFVANYFKCKRIAIKDFIKDDAFRTPQIKLLLGENTFVTVVENKIRYSFDIEKCMFSRGNITEKIRISQIDCSEKVIVDLYAGIGYFTLPYLVHSKAKHVYACEWNPNAIEFLRLNLIKNKVKDRCTILEGDNKKNCPKDVADRVNVGLLPSSESGWTTACTALNSKTGGILHIHATVHSKFKILQCICKRNIDGNQTSLDANLENNETYKYGGKDNTESFMYNNQNCIHCKAKSGSTHLQNMDDASSDDKVITLKVRPLNDETSIILYDKTEFIFNNEKMNKFTSLNNNLIEMMKLKKKKVPTGIEWSYYVCYQLNDIFVRMYNKEWNIRLLHIEHVKSYSPNVAHLVFDIKCHLNHI